MRGEDTFVLWLMRRILKKVTRPYVNNSNEPSCFVTAGKIDQDCEIFEENKEREICWV
jgi:NRPS condensation-like uncharacterized protein